MNEYQTMSQMGSYACQMYEPSKMEYESGDNPTTKAYSSGGGSEGSGVMSAPTISMLP